MWRKLELRRWGLEQFNLGTLGSNQGFTLGPLVYTKKSQNQEMSGLWNLGSLEEPREVILLGVSLSFTLEPLISCVRFPYLRSRTPNLWNLET